MIVDDVVVGFDMTGIRVVDEDNISDVKSDSAVDIAANEGGAEEDIAAVAA